MNKLLITVTLLVIATCSVYAQNKTIKGRVIDEYLERTPADIIINDSVKVGTADLNGFFQIETPVAAKKITFRFLGFEPAIIELTDECPEVDVVMMYSVTYDFISPKKVERLRKKRFSKLPEIHKQAFDKGIFKTDKACYKQELYNYRKVIIRWQ